MNKTFFQKHGDSIVVVLVLCVILGFIFNYIPLDLLLLKTTTAGGDTGAHTYPAQYMYDYLLPHFKIVGWAPGWYAGFPMFQFYFPLPFVLISVLGVVFSVQVAFKLVTFLAIILIPLSAFLLFRLLRFPKLESSLGAIFMLPFLFMEANSMWGGNIPSTFAGEFSYALGFSLSLVYLGLLYRGIEDRSHMLKNVMLLGVIGITHAYDLLWVVLSSVFVLFGSDFKRRFAYWFQVNAIAFLLISFWVIPWVYYAGYSTAYGDFWKVGLKEIFPKIFWPFYILTLIGVVYGFINKEKRFFYLLFSIAAAAFYYFFSVEIGGVNIRFVPFVQVMLLLIAAYSFTLLFNRKFRALRFIPIIVLLLTILWVQPNIKFIGSWAKWNYEGFEKKNVWPQFSGVNDFLKGDENDPRVVYEHSDKHNAAGTTRAFELLPLFSGRSTLEGLYMQSSPSSPFIFYVQSETSKAGSCPFPSKKCTSFNLSAGFEHLKLFNVNQFVAISDEVKGALRNHTSYKLVFESQPYEVFELLTNETGYVVIPKYKPVFFPRENWQDRSYELFPKNWDVPIIFDADVKEEPAITREVIDQNCIIESEVKEEEILFNTSCVGMPHLIKVSYFPRWKSENGEKIHLVSPSFMLIYPEKEQVRLYFGRTWIDNITSLFTLLGLLILFAYRPIAKRLGKSQKFKFLIGFIDGLLTIVEKGFVFLWSKAKRASESRFTPAIILFVLITLYISFFSILSIDKHNRFQSFAFDLGIFDQSIWQFSRFSTPFNTVRGLHILGDNFSLINAFISPIYWFWDDVRALLVLQTIMLAAAAIPLFLIAKHYFKNKWIPLILCLSYLLFPAVHHVNLEDYHAEAFAPFLILFAFYFLIKGKKWSYLIFFFLALITKEEIAVTTFLLGIYVYFKHDKKLGILTSMFSLVWLFLVFEVFVPFFNNAGYMYFDRSLGNFGSNTLDIILGILSAKVLFPVLFSQANATYMWGLFAPVGFIALLNPLTLVISASLWGTLVASWTYAHSINYHYVLPIVPFIFISLVIGMARFQKRKILTYSLLLILVIAALASNHALAPNNASIRSYEDVKKKMDNFKIPSQGEVETYHMLSLIPITASVSASYNLVPQLTHRNKIYMFPNPFKASNWGAPGQVPLFEHVDYLLLSKTHMEEHNAILAPLLENDTYNVIYQSEEYKLFERSR